MRKKGACTPSCRRAIEGVQGEQEVPGVADEENRPSCTAFVRGLVVSVSVRKEK